MVYNRIDIVWAYRIPAKVWYTEFLNKDPLSYDDDMDDYLSVVYLTRDILKLDSGVYIGPPQCCRDDISFILVGKIISTIHRRHARCENCPSDRINCNKCFSDTDSGYYDFSHYFEPLRECDPRGICKNCKFDHRRLPPHIACNTEATLRLLRTHTKSLWSKFPKDVFNMILDYLAHVNEIRRPERCSRCNYKLKSGLSKRSVGMPESFTEEFDTKKLEEISKPKFYYVHNDCGSCT